MSSNLSVSTVAHVSAQGPSIAEPTTTKAPYTSKIQYFAFAILLGSGVLLGCLTVVTVALPIKATLIAGSSVATISSFAVLALFPKKNPKIETAEPPIVISPHIYTLKQQTEDHKEVSEQTTQLRKEQMTKAMTAVQQPLTRLRLSDDQKKALFKQCKKFSSDHNKDEKYDADHIFPDIIAARGPQGNTMNAFWEMIFERKSRLIVMLANFQDNQCFPYLPVQECGEKLYGSVKVTWKNRRVIHPNPDPYPNEESETKVLRFVERVFEVSDKEGSQKLEVHHIHVENWPDVSVIPPEDLFKLVKIVDELQRTLRCIITIHCQMGVGRTGTLANALKVYRRRKNGNNDPALPLHVLGEMREIRPNMIHTDKQFDLCVKTDLLHRKELLSRTTSRTAAASGA